MFKLIDKISNDVAGLFGLQGERGEFVSVVVSLVLFYAIAWLFVTGVAFITGISTGALWSLVMVGCLVHIGFQYIKR